MPHEPRQPDRYRRTMMDRLGPDGGLLVKAVAYGLMVFGLTISAILFVAAQGGGISLVGFLGATLVGLVAGALTSAVAFAIGHGTGVAFRAFIQPSGASTPYQREFSYQESLAARGLVAEAAAGYEELIAAAPDDVEVRVRAAELYVRHGRDLRRAEALYKELRRLPQATPRHDVFASNRLIDLYLGALPDPGRALVELRRLIERYPGTEPAQRAREALARMKAGAGEAEDERGTRNEETGRANQE